MSKPIKCRNNWRIRWIDPFSKKRMSAVFKNKKDAKLVLNTIVDLKEMRKINEFLTQATNFSQSLVEKEEL